VVETLRLGSCCDFTELADLLDLLLESSLNLLDLGFASGFTGSTKMLKLAGSHTGQRNYFLNSTLS
jgi:hypothetical protein